MPLPASMRCIEIKAPGGPEMLVPAMRPLPTPGDGEVLIAVSAAGVNRPDVIQRLGQYPAPADHSDLPGLEVAGTVVAQGRGVTTPAVGDRICALTPGGGYAEYVTVPAGSCLPFPKGFTDVEAAALPETFFTVWHNVFQRGALKKGEVLLIHGGSSGIGTTAIQLGKAFGAFVAVTAGSAEKCDACTKLGADLAINYRSEDFAEVLKARAPGKGADVILDMVGAPYLARNLKCLKPDGRMVNIAFLEGARAEVDMMPVMLKRLTLTGSTLRARDAAFKAGLADALRAQVWPLLDAGTVKPVIHAILPLDQAAEAHRLMESSRHIGKIMLQVSPTPMR